MIPENFNINKFQKEYLKQFENDEYLMKTCQIDEDVDYVLQTVYEDEVAYSEEDIKRFVDLICIPMQKIALTEQIKSRADVYDILFALSEQYMDFAKEIMSTNLSDEEMQNEMFKRLLNLSSSIIEERNMKEQEQEYKRILFAIKHPILSKVLPFILILACIIGLAIAIFQVGFIMCIPLAILLLLLFLRGNKNDT